MRFAVDLTLDPIGENKINKFGQLVNKKINPITKEISVVPHLRLGSFEDISEQSLVNSLAQIIEQEAVFQVNFSYLGVFPGAKILFCGAILDEKLLNLHSSVHETIADSAYGPDRRLLPGKWIPHCSLITCQQREELKQAFDDILTFWQPIQCDVSKIILIKQQPFNKTLHEFTFPKKFAVSR